MIAAVYLVAVTFAMGMVVIHNDLVDESERFPPLGIIAFGFMWPVLAFGFFVMFLLRVVRAMGVVMRKGR